MVRKERERVRSTNERFGIVDAAAIGGVSVVVGVETGKEQKRPLLGVELL